MFFLSASDFNSLWSLQNVALSQHCLEPPSFLLPLSPQTFDTLSVGRFCLLLFALCECKPTVYSSPLEWNWGTLHMELDLSLSKSSGHEGEVTYLTARAIQNLQNLFTAVPVANQRPPSLKSITCLPGDLPNSSSPWEATIVPSPPGSLPPVRPFFLPNVIPSEEPSFLLPVYQKPCQLSAAH